MTRQPFSEIKTRLETILLSRKVPKDLAEAAAQVITQNSCDGVLSHGLGRFPRLIRQIDAGEIDPQARPEPVSHSGSLEVWEGHRGIGITNALAATDRAVSLARDQGLGLVALKNTTHWLRAGAYGWRAAEKGTCLIAWTNTTPNLPPWGCNKALTGNNPLVVAVPREEGPFVVDMAMSQYSYGAMAEYVRRGETLPTPGGWNEEGDLTDNPKEVLESGRPLPAGFWKGSALAIILDLLAAVLAEGSATAEISPEEANLSQIFLAISLTGSQASTARRVGAEIESQLAGCGGARYPGQRVLKLREENLLMGIPVPQELLDEIARL